jgi:hypothetical protein
MKSEVSNSRRSIFARVMALAVFGVAIASATNGCVGGSEGDRCNPSQTDHPECGSGLTCQMPSTCVENYCCPTPASKSSNGYCNGTLCPAASDAGADSGP